VTEGFDTAIYTVADEAGKVEGLEKLYGTIFKPTKEEQDRMLQLHAELLVEQISNEISKP
jgi:nitrogen fixation protein FixH